MNQSYQYEFGNFLFAHFDCDLSYILMMAFHTFWLWPWSEKNCQMELIRWTSTGPFLWLSPQISLPDRQRELWWFLRRSSRELGRQRRPPEDDEQVWRFWWALFHPHLKYVGEDNLETENDMYLGGFVQNSNQVEPAESCWILSNRYGWV